MILFLDRKRIFSIYPTSQEIPFSRWYVKPSPSKTHLVGIITEPGVGLLPLTRGSLQSQLWPIEEKSLKSAHRASFYYACLVYLLFSLETSSCKSLTSACRSWSILTSDPNYTRRTSRRAAKNCPILKKEHTEKWYQRVAIQMHVPTLAPSCSYTHMDIVQL